MPRRERLKYAVIACALLAEPGFLIYYATTPGNTGIYLPPSIALAMGGTVLVGLLVWVLRGRG